MVKKNISQGKAKLSGSVMTQKATNKQLLETFLPLYKDMLKSRYVDQLEEEYTSRGEAFFHVSGAGHEAIVALNPHLIAEDYLHPHYRDKSLMIARGISPEMFFHSLFCKDGSHSRGRQMSAHMSDPALHVLSMVGPVGNNALQSAGVAMGIKNKKNNPIVLCAMGDGTTQEGESLESIAEAVRWELPVLFLVEDNSFAISTKTKGKTFFSRPDGDAEEFYGIPITRISGLNFIECYEAFENVVRKMRKDRKPAIVHFAAERLSNHTNADDHRIYRDTKEIEQIRIKNDPILFAEEKLMEWGFDTDELSKIKDSLFLEVREAAERSQKSPDPKPCFHAKRELPDFLKPTQPEYIGNPDEKTYTMIEAIRNVFKERMAIDPTIRLYGQDIEDPKGDVFGLTKGLTDAYPNQVLNAPLTESTIVGVGVGLALAGETPVVFLQFADFLPIAFNQIISEMGSLYWRTDGGWQVPMIVMITCGGYRPGLGPFHAQTLESIGAHTPGVDVMMPSTAGDAAGLLNAAFESKRPTLFFYPKSCLNEKKHATSTDITKQIVPVGKARFTRKGGDLTMVCYGNLVNRCNMAADELEKNGFSVDVIDLRTIFPWDKEAVIKSVKKTKKLIVTHEDNKTAGMGGEIISTIAEALGGNIQYSRITRPDTYVPCNFDNQLDVLPSYKSILNKAAEMLNLEPEWEALPEREPGINFVNAMGTSPSDETVTITEWMVTAGETIKKGQLIAEFEANKAASEMLSPISGEILEMIVPAGEMVDVGTPLLRVKTGDEIVVKPVTQEVITNVSFKRKQITIVDTLSASNLPPVRKSVKVGLANIATAKSSKKVSNEEIVKLMPDKTPEDIVKMTGIESRNHIQGNESVLSLGVKAAKEALKKANLKPSELDMVVVATGTPELVTPSLACLILSQLEDENEITAKAYDINAACSGYLYSLQNSYDFIQSQPDAKILVITAEVLSPLLNLEDFNTAILFGDAATASILYGEDASQFKNCAFEIKRPILSSRPENGNILNVPLKSSGEQIFMNGKKVFSEAVKKMTLMLEKACRQENISVSNLDLIVPHQANMRIIDAIRKRIGFPENKVFINIEQNGNTSSNTIPIALSDAWEKIEPNKKIGLCAFGGGFTFSAGVIKKVK